jgi:class 3 adenylate cyclase
VNPYALPFLMSFVPLILLGLAIILQNPSNRLYQIVCAFCIGNALVAGTGGMLHLAASREQAVFWNRLPYLLNCVTYWLFLQYTLIISGGEARMGERFFFLPVRVHYWLTIGVLALVFGLVGLSDTIVAAPVHNPVTGWEHGYGPLHREVIFANVYLLVLLLFILQRGIKTSPDPILRRARIISMAAIGVAQSWVIVTGLVLPDFFGVPTHSFAAIAWLVLCFLLIYGLMRQQWETIHEFSANLEEKVAMRTEELARAKNNLEEVQAQISKYLDPHVVEKIFAGELSAELTSRRARLTMFFSDIKDFTQFTDASDPEEVARLLNEYLGEMAMIVRRWGGTIPQFTGDSIYAIFGAPDSRGAREDALAAVRMALEMQSHMEHLRRKWWNEGIQFPFQIRCGIHSGMANVGNYGSEGFMEFSAIGLNVNLASRLEHICQPGQVYVSHATWALVKDEIPCEEVGAIEVKGFHYPIQVYRVMPRP